MKTNQITGLETQLANTATPVSITGTHTETTTAIDFSTAQGKSITLTADRSYTITGLSSTNPTGILEITHAGFTPSFSGVTVLDTFTDESGVYYLKFIRQASGTVTVTNQGGAGGTITPRSNLGTFTGSSMTIDSNGYYSEYTLAANLTLSFASSGHVEEKARYVKAIFEGTYTLMVAAVSGLGINISGFTDGAAPTAGTYMMKIEVIGGEIYIDLKAISTILTSEIMYDDFTGVDGDPPNTATKWNLTNANGGIEFSIDTSRLKVTSTAANTANFQDMIESQDTTDGMAVMSIDLISQTANLDRKTIFGVFVDGDNRASIAVSTGGNAIIYIYTGAALRYWVDTGISAFGNRWKITVDSDNTIKYYYYDSGWTQVGVTQTAYAIGTGRRAFLSVAGNTAGANISLFDRVRFDNTDYSTELP